jgi:hypothetical protein
MFNETPQQTPEQEPTVLDLYKSVVKDWTSFFNFIRSLWDARRREELNRALADEVAQQAEERPAEPPRATHFPWRSTLALFVALVAQFSMEPPSRQSSLGLALYIFAIGFALWAHQNDEWHLPALPVLRQTPDDQSVRVVPFLLSIAFALTAFFAFGADKFTLVNVSLWILALVFLVYGLWLKLPKVVATREANLETRREKIILGALVLAAFGVALFFRLYRIDAIPVEPFSDHAEKILDVYDISQGDYNIFFVRNTGREAFQMYWTYLIAGVFGTGLSFLSLKLGTALLGILTLPYIYLLGKEYGNERVGLFALFLFGISYWNNVIARIGLRFPLYPLFAAPTLFYLTRGLRTRNRNDFILAGFFLGVGLHGYSPFRIMPILVVVAFAIYLAYARENFQQTLRQFVVVVATSLFVFLPLLRYWISHPDIFGYRALTRLSSAETPLPGSAWQIFLSNLYNGLLMFNWDDGEIWVNSLPHRPALDFVTGALFVIGVVLLIARYVRGRDWRDLFLLVSIPVLLMPSVLSLAFPGENPALNRSGGAAVAAILVGALALEGVVSAVGAQQCYALTADKKRAFVAYGLTGILFAISAYQNYDLVFNKFDASFRMGAWNTSEMGQVISQFQKQHGQTDTVWIVPFPHWVDTRLPGVWAGIPNRDFAIWQQNFADTLAVPAPKMFIFWNADIESQNALTALYPNGVLNRYTSAFPGKDFMILTVEK